MSARRAEQKVLRAKVIEGGGRGAEQQQTATSVMLASVRANPTAVDTPQRKRGREEEEGEEEAACRGIETHPPLSSTVTDSSYTYTPVLMTASSLSLVKWEQSACCYV